MQMHRITMGIGALLAMLTLAGCQTTQGLGQDISTAGEVIQQEGAEAM
ncbi:entericidin, EcnA/B family [Paracoccus subflavus]